MNLHVDVELRNLEEFKQLLAINPFLLDGSTLARNVDRIKKNGAFDPFAGYMLPSSIDIQGTNYRETIVGHGTNSRGRGVLSALADFVVERGTGVDVYASEWVSPFSQRLKGIFGTNFIGSEYLPSSNDRAKYPAIRHEDVQALSFPSQTFDLYVSCEVLEHIPYLDRAISEAYRILRPSGLFVGTVPFAFMNTNSIVHSTLLNGMVHHVLPPEFHGNPVDPSGGSLVFEIPGWDFLDRCRMAGFQDAAMRLIASTKNAILGGDLVGTLVFVARV